MAGTFDFSKATAALDTVTSTLGDTSILLNRVQPPVVQVVVVIQQIDGYLKDGEQCLDVVNNVLKVLHNVLQICGKLANLIPEVGPILAKAANMIENLHIEQSVKKIADEIAKLIHDVRCALMTYT